ncbi:transposase, partial [Candidatus Woesearchaeota archaeon]|nr:transposase [Candidatus Woesearchaeota archaeon]
WTKGKFAGSVGHITLDVAKEYVKNQEAHHAKTIRRNLHPLGCERRSSLKKEYTSSFYDNKFKKELVNALNQTKKNCELYDGSINGKLFYEPICTGILFLLGTLSIGVSALIDIYEKKQKGNKK